MSDAADTGARLGDIEAALHAVQMLCDARLSPDDRARLSHMMGLAFSGGDGSARGLVALLVQVNGHWTEQQREMNRFLECEFQQDVGDDRWRMVAAIRGAIQPRHHQPSLAEIEARMQLEAEAQRAEAQRELFRRGFEAFRVAPPLSPDHERNLDHERMMAIIRNIK